ncbi:MAG TPA: hypothetical protein V6D19_08530 [Stenomitos sp.]
MEAAKKERLVSKGWKIGTVSDFLELTPEETIFVEIKLALRGYLETPRCGVSIVQASRRSMSRIMAM